jgi:hypothetical protein
MQSADAYHVLTLNRREIRLFEGNRDALEEIDLVPGARTITEALGAELTEPHLTVASYGGAGSVAQRHGHGSKNDEIDVERSATSARSTARSSSTIPVRPVYR